MTAADESLPLPGESSAGSEAASAEAPAGSAARRTFWERVDAWVETGSEWLNPILVKETRQALKSKQFVITFVLLLLCGWVWSLLGVAIVGPGIRYSAQGPFLFYGYFLILAFPLAVIVPFAAFRSLAAECEDGTYELLSITTLKSRQIISGKLGSAVLQMLVYLSAISPCLAFTYMLGGIDFPSILIIIFYAVLGSLGLSMISLCLATVTDVRHWQVVLSVFVIAGLLFVFGLAWAAIDEVLYYPQYYFLFDNKYFWIANGAIVTAFVGYFALFFLTARAQLMAPSENRSTALRVCMLLQQAAFTGWMAWIFLYLDSDLDEMPLVYLTLLVIHWWLMGAFMTGERAELSPRVKRSLPQTFLGRLMFTWFNPGSGTGYLFALVNYFSAFALLACLVLVYFTANLGGYLLRSPALPTLSREWQPDQVATLMAFGVVSLSYLTIFLGLGRLLVLWLRRFAVVGVFLSLLLQILLFLIAIFVPLVIQWSSAMRYEGYNLLQISNAPWTLVEIGDGPMPRETPTLLVLLSGAAFLVLLLNLPSAAKEIRQTRVLRPRRVEEEDAELHPPLAEPPKYVSPWDEDEPSSTDLATR